MKKSSRSKTTNRRETKIDGAKIFSPEILRANLLLSSLYLTSYEILKIAIVEGVKDFFIYQTPISDDAEKELLNSVDPTLVERLREGYQKEVNVILPQKSRHKRCPYPVDLEEQETDDGREETAVPDLHGRIQAGSLGITQEQWQDCTAD
jgi:hypothetical protein